MAVDRYTIYPCNSRISQKQAAKAVTAASHALTIKDDCPHTAVDVAVWWGVAVPRYADGRPTAYDDSLTKPMMPGRRLAANKYILGVQPCLKQ